MLLNYLPSAAGFYIVASTRRASRLNHCLIVLYTNLYFYQMGVTFEQSTQGMTAAKCQATFEYK